jgi:cobaltochelatase CobS
MEASMTAQVKTENNAIEPINTNSEPTMEKRALSEVFDLGNTKAAKRANGDDIMVSCLENAPADYAHFIPRTDENYIYNIEMLTTVLVAFELNIPLLLWGYHGTGKTTVAEQFAARTGRPAIRVQHTVSTEEAHILGQILVKDGETVFEPGPLAVAMKYGLTYIADEYDFALPNVVAVYQPVLEGKALLIKEAPAEWRLIEPHPNFRFVATGNTNGGGDDTGLYQGTQIQNAANYSRFGVTIEVEYMPQKQEVAVVAKQTRLHADDATKLVDFAWKVRDAFKRSEITTTVSPRELITAAKLSRAMARPETVNGADKPVMRPNLRRGLQLAFINRLSPTDRKAVDDFAQRIFG